MKKESSFDNLYKKIDATSKTRFHSSRRLKNHAKWSTYTVVLISLSLILISLMQAYGLGKNIQSDLIGLIQAFAAIAVLVYSLLIDKNDYSSHAEKLYSCASQLGELKQKIYPYLEKDKDETNDNNTGSDGNFNEEVYNASKDEYHKILAFFETHSSNDFRGDYYRAKIEMPEHYEIKGINWLIFHIRIFFLYSLNYSSYPLVAACISYVFFWLC